MRLQLFNSLIFKLLTSFLLVVLGSDVCVAAPLVLKDDYRSPRNKERPLRKATRLIVLHTTEAHAKSSLNKLSERGEAHYCVTEKGEVYRIIDRDREAFHAGRSMWNAKEDCDEFSIGIEVVGRHDQSMPLRQLEALKELVDRLKKLYGITDAQVVCHSHVAYGAPNTWHKKKHRGRKRCGMLFAMPSVRAKLGLKARPAFDPDVKAKRLVQADPYLNSILYGSVDTMVALYGKPRAQIAVTPKAPEPVKSGPAKPVVAQKPTPPKSNAPARSSQVAQGKSTPPPIRKPPLIVPKAESLPATGKVVEAEGDWMTTVGLKGGYFKKKARLVIPDMPQEMAQGDTEEPESMVLPLPENLHIPKSGDTVRDLATLVKLPGYVRGGPVGPDRSPFKIAGSAWRLSSTYYYSPRGKITTGNMVDEKSIEPGTFIFFKK